MKKIKFLYIALITTMLVGSCKQEPIIPATPVAVTPAPAFKGTADFTKFIVLGDSYSAGMQGGALFDEGQAASMAKIMANQFSAVGGGAFNQPDINHVNGYNSSASTPGMGIFRGRFILFDPDGATDPDGAGCQVSRSAGPKAAGTPAVTTQPTSCDPPITLAVPAPYNTAQTPAGPAWLFDPTKIAALNNFGVPGARIIHANIPGYGVGNPFFGRFGTSVGASMIGDATAKAGSFFMLYLGNFDILNYATAGGVGNPNGTGSVDMTPEAVFTPSYTGNLTAMLATPNSKGVVGTIPDITTLPFFFTVLWNAIEFKVANCTDAATIASLNGATGFGGYNSALDFFASAAGGNAITPAEAASRKVFYAYGKNGILIADETLTNLTAQFVGPFAALAPYVITRQAKATDLITLSAGAILGTCQIPPGGTVPSASYVGGVSAPLADQFVLLPTEIADIQARTNAFNVIITNAAAANVDLAVADVNKAYKDLLAAKAMVIDGVTITPSFAPPAGAFSEDGLHPNGRGYAFTANVFISAINAKFGANVYKANVAAYAPTKLPVVP